jgi:hypothetical protein
MSGPLLIGIVATGAALTWVFRKHGDATQPAAAATDAAHIAAMPPTDANTVAATDKTTDGLAGVKVAPPAETPPIIGDQGVGGVDGGQVIKTINLVEGDTVAVDHAASTGGADPSTLTTQMHSDAGNGPVVDHAPGLIIGDTQDTVMRMRYGVDGANGMTSQQVSKAYAESAVWSGEVF